MKKVLIIPYYWAPSGGAGVQRWLKLTKYLAMMGVEVHVVTVDENYASYTHIDESLVDDIHPDVKVHKTKSFEPINYYARVVGKKNIPTAGFSNVNNNNWKQRFATTARSNLFIPDPRKGWKKYAVKKAAEVIQKEKIKTVITTSPPHSVQLIGLALKKKFDIKWIVDFRDPWTDIYYYSLLGHTRFSKYFDKQLEKKVLEKCDQIITGSNGFRASFLSKTKKINKEKFQIIPNGYDHEDFENVEKSSNINNSTFTITYTGTISDQYEPQIFFEVLDKIAGEKKHLQIQYRHIGSLSPGIQNYLNSLDYVNFEFIQTVPHHEVTQYQKDANLLFLAIPNVTKAEGILTGKIFEYLGSRNKIVAIGPAGGDIAEILQQCNSGKIFDRKNQQPIYDYLLQRIEDFENGIPVEVNEKAIVSFSRKAQAESVAKLIIDK